MQAFAFSLLSPKSTWFFFRKRSHSWMQPIAKDAKDWPFCWWPQAGHWDPSFFSEQIMQLDATNCKRLAIPLMATGRALGSMIFFRKDHAAGCNQLQKTGHSVDGRRQGIGIHWLNLPSLEKPTWPTVCDMCKGVGACVTSHDIHDWPLTPHPLTAHDWPLTGLAYRSGPGCGNRNSAQSARTDDSNQPTRRASKRRKSCSAGLILFGRKPPVRIFNLCMHQPSKSMGPRNQETMSNISMYVIYVQGLYIMYINVYIIYIIYIYIVLTHLGNQKNKTYKKQMT